ncbi:type II toxin-antitoxin system VapC family toxin [Pseudomonas sp. 5P_3.1_Bac2]|uniref:type II toxin-antitoxin system VapC family toxin n=1 Tax=Pseudomonas sp. 5P_3.1_Bac2 TaxID=2971617 RepID=UPI0021C98ADD|nr:type II toxin-antitoxin system VapC family toxin [Pseudomonas sp. 5P_3.1_Bac2]MCU1717701.1 type II toxin-antitoxin system VapC family toxin [Pseudomonas sp. 5P_3.1_Bac2]
MILLDTNVLSELMKANPEPAVIAWVDAQPVSELFTSSISVAEVLYGIARMPEGKRKQSFFNLAQVMFDQDFAGRIVAFDADAAVYFASLAAGSEAKGRVVGLADGQIAAIAAVYDAQVATRNVRHFDSLGVQVINPWDA